MAQTGVSGVAQTGVSVVAQTGVSGVGQTDCGHPRFVVVCRYSKTARNAATCALGIAPSEPVNPTPSCGFEQRNP